VKTKKLKTLYICLCCFTFFNVLLFALSADITLATGLEVKYPEISGQSITTSTKFPEFALYIFNAGMALGYFSVLISLVIAGVMYVLSPAKPDLVRAAKDRISGAISGLLILTFTYLIITTINPQLNVFKLNELEAIPEEVETEKKPAGVYFYKESGCSDKETQPYISSVPDLGDLKNTVGSVEIVKDDETKTAYISILYDNTNLWGKCLYVNPNKPCSPGASWAASASVHQYNFSPNDDGVYFFRKACFNKIDQPYKDITGLIDYCKKQSGGWYKVDNSEIKGIFGGDKGNLQKLVFNDVPEEEQNCTKYDKDEKCIQRTPPTLGGENISSIIIRGNYLVLFVYQGPGGTSAGPWDSCQEFPTSNDVNNLGPQQIKWENIRNNDGVIPNYVLIFPIKK